MLDITARLTLTLAREQAELAAAVLQTWKIVTSACIATTGFEAGRKYNEGVQALYQREKNGKEVDTGGLRSPHIRI